MYIVSSSFLWLRFPFWCGICLGNGKRAAKKRKNGSWVASYPKWNWNCRNDGFIGCSLECKKGGFTSDQKSIYSGVAFQVFLRNHPDPEKTTLVGICWHCWTHSWCESSLHDSRIVLWCHSLIFIVFVSLWAIFGLGWPYRMFPKLNGTKNVLMVEALWLCACGHFDEVTFVWCTLKHLLCVLRGKLIIFSRWIASKVQ